MALDHPYKQCKICDAEWATRDQFIDDPEIVLIGYQANFVVVDKGLFLFNHICQNTLSVPAHDFSDLYDGPVFQERLVRSDACAGYCLHQNNLRPCPGRCECAYVREVMQLLKKTAKKTDRAI